MTIVAFTVHDLPRPQGSKRGFINKSTGKVALVESGGEPLRSWREAVKSAALDNLPKGHVPYDGPVRVYVTFYLPRPQSHYRTGRNAELLRDNAPKRPKSKPDLDKLIRSSLDSLTAAGVFVDDSRVVTIIAGKHYCGGQVGMAAPGAKVEVVAA